MVYAADLEGVKPLVFLMQLGCRYWRHVQVVDGTKKDQWYIERPIVFQSFSVAHNIVLRVIHCFDHHIVYFPLLQDESWKIPHQY